ncbi:hypothetical protein SBV1_410073 [Verrucomicrobia bacterium]|nr:hypothetical protein SBV1_410073 [Verrucomicrobiota bacterium]
MRISSIHHLDSPNDKFLSFNPNHQPNQSGTCANTIKKAPTRPELVGMALRLHLASGARR